MLDINKQIKNSITITPFNILDALKNIKCGKSSGIDSILQNTLYLLIVAFMCYYHYYFLPLSCMATCLVCL